MPQVVVDSGVMRDKAKTILTAATKINSLYAEMDTEITTVGGRMKGTTIDTAVRQFKSMKPKFDSIYADLNKYNEFLSTAAENYDRVENDGTQMAQSQGKIF